MFRPPRIPEFMLILSQSTPLCLGSASPRRRELLGELKIPLEVLAANVEEGVHDGESSLSYLDRVVYDKLTAVHAKLPPGNRFSAILVADTIVVIDDTILGKPVDVEDAMRLLRQLTGRVHTVYTRYAIQALQQPSAKSIQRTVLSRVTLRAASESEIRRYAQTGEGLDKAGAYAAQGIGGFLIERVDGSYTNVVGLPLCEVVLDLKALDLLPEFP
jgi:septum formation protein